MLAGRAIAKISINVPRAIFGRPLAAMMPPTLGAAAGGASMASSPPHLASSSTTPSRAKNTKLAHAAAGAHSAASGDRLQPPPAARDDGWRLLGTPRAELTLQFTLPTGQTFRFRKTGVETYTGVIGARVVQLRQLDDDVAWRVLARGADADAAGDAAALRDYFQLEHSLADLFASWSAADAVRFAAVAPYFSGARMLRQPPLECLFEFLCSSNNHISRIQGMVERLAADYGTPLVVGPAAATELAPPLTPGAAAAGVAVAVADDDDDAAAAASNGLSFHAFPTLEQLGAATEEALRGAGFGYRARYVTGTAAMLAAKEGGGEAWLAALRRASYEDAVAALVELPGIGPKVAACVCLFSLDKPGAVPVDTHVWALAGRHYDRRLAGKPITKDSHARVQALLGGVFGPRAGWAHNVLFIAELAQHCALLPPHLQPGDGGSGGGGKKRAAKAAASKAAAEAKEGDDGSPLKGAGTPAAGQGRGKRARRPRALPGDFPAASISTSGSDDDGEDDASNGGASSP